MSCKRSCYRNKVAVLTRKCRSRSDAAWCGVRSDLHCLLIWFRILLLSIIKLHHVAKLQKYIKDNNSEKCELRHEKTCFLHMRKQKAQVSCAVIAQRINACAFATKTTQFLYFYVRPGLCWTWSGTRRQIFSRRCNNA